MSHISEDELARINTALEQTKGHRAAAAKLLGVPPARVYTALKNNEAMRLKWGIDDPVVPAGPISHIDRPLPLYSPADEQTAGAITNQDATLAQGLQKLGYNEDERNFLGTLETAYSGHIQQTLSLTYGGLIHSFTRMLFAQRRIEELIAHIDDNPDAYERTMTMPGGAVNTIKTAHEFRLELVDRYLALAGEIRKMNEAALKSSYVKAQIDKIKADMAGGAGAGRGKPAWGGPPPFAVQVNVHGKAEVKNVTPQS